MKKRILQVAIVSFVFANLAASAFCGIKTTTKEAVFYPEKKFGRICRIEFTADKTGTCFMIVKNADGETVKVVPAEYKKGKNKVDWDGRDSSGALVPQGQYTATLSDGISWSIDKTFGLNGRIGEILERSVVDNPDDCSIKINGIVAKVEVNGKEFTKVDSFEVAGPYYTLKDGVLTLSPVAGLKKGDKVNVFHYFPVYMDNPWDIELDSAGNIYVLINYKTEKMRYPCGRMLKLSPDGRSLDEDFAIDGIISPKTRCAQIDISEKLRKIFITEHSFHRIGVYSLRTGAPLYKIGGGHGDKTMSNTSYPTGAVVDSGGRELFVNTGAVKTFDPLKEGKAGVLRINTKNASYAPIKDNYWGPSLERGVEAGVVYRGDYGSRIMKFKDTGKDILSLYSLRVKGSPVGMSVDKDHGILFAALRTIAGKVAVVRDTGMALQLLTELTDPELGPVHDVEYSDGFLYVLEDGAAVTGRPGKAMKKCNIPVEGKNRISRYKLILAPGKESVKIIRK